MKKKPRKKKTEETVGHRLQQICETRFGGSARKMADALGVSQAAGWRVIQGKQAPTGAFLSGLAALPDVDLNWVFRGKGEPPRAEQTVAIPIAREVLPGLPEEYSGLLTTETFGVSGSLYRPSRYWVEIQPSDPIVLSEPQKARARDLVLMDADPQTRPRAEHLSGDLCGVRLHNEDETSFKLGLVTCHHEEHGTEAKYLGVDTFDSTVDPSEIIRETVVREYPDGNMEAHARPVRMVSTRRGRKTVRAVQHDGEPILRRIKYEDIVCTFVLLVRRHLASES